MGRFLKFITRRIAAIPLTLLIITLVLYGIVMLMPLESRISLYMPNSRSMIPGWQDRMRVKIIERHHLDESFPIQYFYWVKSLFEEEWGFSPSMDNMVLPELQKRTPVTIEVIIYALLTQIPLGLIAGVLSAQNKDKIPDLGTRLATFIATSLPDFILAIVLLAVFYVSLYWFPPERLSLDYHFLVRSDEFINYTHLVTIDGLLNGRADVTLDALRHLVLPVFTLGFSHWAILTRLTRTQVLEQMQMEYITAAYARGLGESTVVWKHAFRNALGPALNNSAVSAASLVTGVYVVERIFNLKGVSDRVTKYGPMVPDAAAVLGFSVYSTVLVLLIMFILDILQAILIPQIKEETLSNEQN